MNKNLTLSIIVFSATFYVSLFSYNALAKDLSEKEAPAKASVKEALAKEDPKKEPPSSPRDRKNVTPLTIEWVDLMPEEDLKILETMNPIDHDTLTPEELALDIPDTNNPLGSNSAISKFEKPASSATTAKKSTERTYEDVLKSNRVRPAFNHKKIKLAGYIVPLEFNEKKAVTAFFLVPYFGACLHVPPPPPNQIIYVNYPKGITNAEIYNPFWVTGWLRVKSTKKDIGASAYTLDAESIAEYVEP